MPIADGLEGEVTHDSPLVTALDQKKGIQAPSF